MRNAICKKSYSTKRWDICRLKIGLICWEHYILRISFEEEIIGYEGKTEDGP
jgi:hypothetical protein